MPKIPKTPRNEPPRDSTVDFPELAREASLTANTTELANETLLQHISETIAAEARRSQTAMDQSIAKLELSLDGKMNNVIKRIDEVAASCDAIGFRQAEAESRTSALEDDMAPLQARVNELIKSNSELASQVLDLQARSRRDNVRILNLRESVEGSNPVLFFEKFIPKLLQLCVSDISIDRAHRTFGPAADDRPRPVIIKFHRSRDVTTVLSAAKRAGDLQYEDRPLRIVPDIPPRCNSSGEASPTSAWSSSREKLDSEWLSQQFCRLKSTGRRNLSQSPNVPRLSSGS
ncbi:unnamed protein product [Knipowitschia caucasica]